MQRAGRQQRVADGRVEFVGDAGDDRAQTGELGRTDQLVLRLLQRRQRPR